MLSRTADNLYWLSRYVERAEYLARIIEATQRLTALPLAYVGESNEWEGAIATAGCASALPAAHSLARICTALSLAMTEPLSAAAMIASKAPATRSGTSCVTASVM